jgi:streptomycin 6-kinase
MVQMMNKFSNNIINIYGNKGTVWLEHLPQIVNDIAKKWNLEYLEVLENLSYNYVLAGYQDTKPIILKIAIDLKSLESEVKALTALQGFGMISLLESTENAILLERAMPGTTLKELFPKQENQTIEIACNLIKSLHQAPIPKNHNFPSLSNWFESLNKDCNIPDYYLNKARQLRDDLLKTTARQVLLHGDLHHENILQNHENWCVIDPKGIIGDATFEVVTFIRNPMPELVQEPQAFNIITNRINKFAKLLNLDQKRISAWCFVEAVISWTWALEDNLTIDIDYFKKTAKMCDKIITQ